MDNIINLGDCNNIGFLNEVIADSTSNVPRHFITSFMLKHSSSKKIFLSKNKIILREGKEDEELSREDNSYQNLRCHIKKPPAILGRAALKRTNGILME